MSKDRNSDVAIIVPVFNEGNVVADVLQELSEKYPNIVCVDDGSTDDSKLQISKSSAVLVTHPINLGQGAALQTGLEYWLQDPEIQYFVTFDADGQHKVDDIDKMIKMLRSEKIDIVLGSRFLGKAQDISTAKKLILKAAIKFTNSTSGIKLTDAHNGLRAFTRNVANELNISRPDFSHASEIVEKIAENKFKYKEVPVTIRYTEYSKAKGQSIFNAVNMGLDIIFDRFSR